MKKININRDKAFTLVELIVVIVILAILGTIAFLSFQGHNKNARDGVRISDMNNINKGLALFQLKGGFYPKPDNFVTISASGIIIGYEGTAGVNVSRIINTNKIILDPLDNIPYVYYTNPTNTTYQLLGYLEGNSLTINNLINTAYANTDYAKRYPKVLGNNLGILLDTSNYPITIDIDLFGSQSGTTYNSYVSNATIKTLSGVELGGPLITLSRSIKFEDPGICPDGFIKVSGNEEFMQPGFCVMKYEASYSTPNNLTTDTTWETDDFTGSKLDIVSRVGGYAIADISQTNAIASCKSLGEGYHLITNHEWMTLARDIEANQVNWSGNAVGSGFIYNGRSDELNMGCDGNGDGNYAEPTGTDCTEKRNDGKSRNILILSNGEEIWDLAGNLWEHVNKANTTIDGTNYNLGKTGIIGSSSGSNFDNDGKYDINDMKKYGSNLGLGLTNGMGNIYYASGVLSSIFIRGGHSFNISNSGIFAMHLNRIESTKNVRVGFRCAK